MSSWTYFKARSGSRKKLRTQNRETATRLLGKYLYRCLTNKQREFLRIIRCEFVGPGRRQRDLGRGPADFRELQEITKLANHAVTVFYEAEIQQRSAAKRKLKLAEKRSQHCASMPSRLGPAARSPRRRAAILINRRVEAAEKLIISILGVIYVTIRTTQGFQGVAMVQYALVHQEQLDAIRSCIDGTHEPKSRAAELTLFKRMRAKFYIEACFLGLISLFVHSSLLHQLMTIARV